MDQPTESLWRTLFSILSLDFAQQFLPEMGLIRGARFVQAVVRQVYPPDKDLFVGGNEQALQQFEAVCHAIGARGVVDAEHRFRNWVREAFFGNHEDQPVWSSWDIAFKNWAYNQQLPQRLRPAGPMLGTVQRVVLAAETDDVKTVYQQHASKPLSEWDLAVFTANDWTGSADEPRILFTFAIGMYRFRLAWMREIEPLSATHKNRLAALATELLAHLGVQDADPAESDLRGPQTCL